MSFEEINAKARRRRERKGFSFFAFSASLRPGVNLFLLSSPEFPEFL
jgi:hypothetical protein